MFHIIFAVFAFSVSCHAGSLVVNNLILDYKNGDRSYRDIMVTNAVDEKIYRNKELAEKEIEKETIFVDTKVFEVKNPGFETETKPSTGTAAVKVPHNNPQIKPSTGTAAVKAQLLEQREQMVEISKSEEATLLVVPSRFVLKPRETKVIRFLISDGPVEKDKIYRVQIFPKVGELVPEGRIALKILVGYEALVIARPDKHEVSFKVWRKGKKITFENTGNTNVLFVEGEQCESKGKKCKKLYGFRLYSGAVKTLDVPYNKSVEYTYDIGGQLITKTFAEKEDAKTYQEVQKKN